MKTFFFYAQLERNFRRKTRTDVRVRSHRTTGDFVFTRCCTFAHVAACIARATNTPRAVWERRKKIDKNSVLPPSEWVRNEYRLFETTPEPTESGPTCTAFHPPAGWIFYPRKTLIPTTVGFYGLISNFPFRVQTVTSRNRVTFAMLLRGVWRSLFGGFYCFFFSFQSVKHISKRNILTSNTVLWRAARCRRATVHFWLGKKTVTFTTTADDDIWKEWHFFFTIISRYLRCFISNHSVSTLKASSGEDDSALYMGVG